MYERSLVSIVIPTKNSGRTIEICLKSIKNQTYRNVEILVVDYYSIDQTRRVAKKYGARAHGHFSGKRKDSRTLR